MENDTLKVFMINPAITVSRIRESKFHVDYKMHQSIDLRMDLEIKAKGSCSRNCTEIYNYMQQWDDILLKKH